MKKTFFLFSLVIIFLACCTLNKTGIIKKRHTKFGITPPDSEWQFKRFKGVDIFLVHNSNKATISVNAECKGVSDSPLEALRAQVLAGLTEINFLSEKYIRVQDREGLETEVEAKLDGVKTYLKIVVLRKNRCVYDLQFTSNKNRPNLIADYDRLVATFWAEADQ